MKEPTEKQKNRIQRLIDHTGINFVKTYFERKFPNSDFDNMTKEEAQKVITVLASYENRSPVLGVVGRDVR